MTNMTDTGKLADVYIELISNALMDEMMDSGKYPETNDEFVQDFQKKYLQLTLMLVNNACYILFNWTSEF